MSLPLGWRGWDIPCALLSLASKGLTPIPEGFEPFLQLGQARGTSACWKGVEILQRVSSSLIFYPPLEHPCGALWCWSLSQKNALKKPLHCGVHPAKKDPATSPQIKFKKLNFPPFSQTRNFCSQLPVETWDGEALPMAQGTFANGNWVLWGSGVGFGGL